MSFTADLEVNFHDVLAMTYHSAKDSDPAEIFIAAGYVH